MFKSSCSGLYAQHTHGLNFYVQNILCRMLRTTHSNLHVLNLSEERNMNRKWKLPWAWTAEVFQTNNMAMDVSQVNLMENIKMSKSRDFRINVQIVQESLQVSSDDDEEQDEEDDNQEQNDAREASPEDEQVSWKLSLTLSCVKPVWWNSRQESTAVHVCFRDCHSWLEKWWYSVLFNFSI